MSVETTHMDGDLSVGRDLAIGGNATIQGNAMVKHNMRVEGWLDAPNIKGVNKGIFTSVENLRNTYPVPQDGWFAGVGTTSPFAAYVGWGGQWVATGGSITITVDASALPVIEEATLQGEIDDLRTDLTTETETRISENSAVQLDLRSRLFVNATDMFNLGNTNLAAVRTAISNLNATRRAFYQKPGLVVTFRYAAQRWQTWQWMGGSWLNDRSWRKIHDEKADSLVARVDIPERLAPVAEPIIGNTGAVERLYVNGVQTAVSQYLTLDTGTYYLEMIMPEGFLEGGRFPNDIFSGCTYSTLSMPDGMSALNMNNQSDAHIESITVPMSVETIDAATLSNTDTHRLEMLGLPPAVENASALGDLNKLTLPREYLTAYLCDATWQSIVQDIKKTGGSVVLSDGTPYGIETEVSLSYIHEQAQPSKQWTVNHNLNRYPSVTVVDSSNNVVVGAITYSDKDTLLISFNGDFSGKAYLN